MAVNKRLVPEAYGVLEKNAVTYPRTGNIMAMYALAEEVTKAENGMLLGVDYGAQEITYPKANSDAIMIHDSAEKEYARPHVAGLNKFYLTPEEGFKPRLGKLEVNDRFTTSAVAYDSAVFADVEAIEAAVEEGNVYGTPCMVAGYQGLIELTKTAPTGKVGLKVVKVTTLPNGDAGIKFAVIKAD